MREINQTRRLTIGDYSVQVPDIEAAVEAEFRSRMRSDINFDVETTPLAALGIDSLDFFEAVMSLEEKLGREIPVEELDAQMTIRSLSLLIENARKPI